MELQLNSADPQPVHLPRDPLGALTVQIVAGSETAMSSLYDATSPRVFGLALRVLRDRSAAEEATLDVFTQVWRQAERYDPAKGSVIAWLLNLARSRSIDLLRSRARRIELEDGLDAAPELPDIAPGPEQSSVDADRARRIRKALAGLPEDQRKAIEAAFFGGLSHAEVALKLGQPLGTVKTRIRTGLLALRCSLLSTKEGLV